MIERLKNFVNQPISMIWLIPLIMILLVIFWGFVSSDLILKTPRIPLDFNPRSFGYDFESFKVLTEDKIEIDCWFVPAKKKSRSTIVVLHGWGANRSDVVPNTTFLAQDHNLLYFDFRNHGRSGGNMSSLTCLEIKDFSAVVRFLKKEKSDNSEKVGVLGFSMGASVAISGSAKMEEVNAIVAESPFSSFNEVISRFGKLFYGLPRWTVPYTLWFTKMRLGINPEECSPIYHISRLSPRPIFIIQGGSDARVPVSEGELLLNTAKEPKELWVVPGADHDNIQGSAPEEEYKKRVLSFFRKWLSS